MLLQHQLIVHLVDVIARQDDHIFGAMAFDDVDVLEDGVGGAFVPLVFGDALGRGQDVEAFIAFGAQEVPALLQMADEGMGLVLGRDADAANARIDRVGQGKIYDAGLAAEIDGRLGAPFGQLGQPRAAATGQHIGHCFTCQGLSAPVGHLILSSASPTYSARMLQHDCRQGRKRERGHARLAGDRAHIAHTAAPIV